MRDRGRRVKAVIVAVVLAVGATALVLTLTAPASTDGDFHGATVPTLFSDAQIATVDAPLKAAEARAHRVGTAWLDAHPTATDAAFGAWALQAVGAPPGGAASRKELAQLQRIAAQRNPTGVTAALWLEQHGKKQPWKALRNQTETFLPRTEEQATKAALKTAFDFAGTLEDQAKARYDRPPPYETDPGLSSGGVRVDSGHHQSYPSSHMVDAGVGLALLRRLDPHMESEYDWMADEVAYSRLYTAGHYLSDIEAGVFLGTLVGDYEVRKQGL
jgi:PAP2 superfamily protein